MPPRKRQKPTVTIHSDLIDSLPEYETPSVTDPDQLSQLQLARAYGLAPPLKKATPQAVDLLRACPPKWTPEARESDSKPKPQLEPQAEVIEIPDTTDDDDLDLLSPKSKPKKVVVKGNGKGKAKEVEVKPRICSFENCSNNPKCLNWLGQDKWEKTSKAWKDYRKSMNLPEDPENDRVEGTPVGLRNLGATCYVNSFLQVWYRDVRFRAGVYTCEPPANGNVESSPLFQLQVLFSFLQTSKQAIYDPTPLVNSLKLDQTEQQDAQEFSKLFLSLLDHEFKKQSLKKEQEGATMNVGKLVQEQFEGTMIYGTRCHSCHQASERPASFLELEVSLTKDCKLENRIKQSFQDEQLKGDNQYYCENCDAKRDATRYSELRSLPPVLHFSLLRFTFNLKDFTRAKSQHAISYPLALDMGQYLPANPATRRKDQVWYDLKGVLMHKGASAHHGHYVAQVYDEEQSKWFLFDDESVSEVEDLNAPDVYDDEDEDPVVGPKAKKKLAAAKSKGFTRDAQGQILPKSKDAYMLVYIRRPDPSEPKLVEPEAPPLARFEVDKIDAEYQKEIEAWNLTTGNAKQAFEKLREEKRSVYNSWDVVEEDEESLLIDKTALRRWVESGLKATPPESASKGKGKEIEVEDDGATSDISPIDKLANADKNGGDTEMQDPSSAASTSPSAPTIQNDSPDLTNGDSNAQAPPSKESSLTPPPASTENDKNGASKPKVELVKVIDNSSVVCPHGHANPAKAEQMKRVSQTAYMTLKELGVEIEPELMTTRDFCRECVAGIARECYYAGVHEAHLERVVPCSQIEENEEFCYISKKWWNDWTKAKPKMHVTSIGTDPSPASHPWIDDVLCRHGRLAADHTQRQYISVEAGKQLQAIFPDFELLMPQICDDCNDTAEEDEAHKQREKLAQQKEKKLFASSFDGQSKIGGHILALSADDQAHYIVPREFQKQCSAWFKSSKKPLPPRPVSLSNDFLLCTHSRLCIDLPKEVDSGKTIAIVTKPEWKYLVKTYNAGPEIRVWIEPGETELTSSVKVCKECLDEKRRNFVTTNLWVKVLHESDLDQNGQRLPNDLPPAMINPKTSTTSAGQSVLNFYGGRGSRVSARNANKAGVLNRKGLKSIEMDRHDKVKDLKPKIEEATGIEIVAQRIFFNLQELEGTQTVQELGLIGDDTIEVFQVALDDDVDLKNLTDVDLDQLDRRGNASKRGSGGGKKRVREEGFGGTGLTGWDRGQDDQAGEGSGGGGSGSVGTPAEDEGESSRGSKRSRSNSRAVSTTGGGGAMDVEQDDTQIPCPHCTYLNDPAMLECEICTGVLAG